MEIVNGPPDEGAVQVPVPAPEILMTAPPVALSLHFGRQYSAGKNSSQTPSKVMEIPGHSVNR